PLERHVARPGIVHRLPDGLRPVGLRPGVHVHALAHSPPLHGACLPVHVLVAGTTGAGEQPSGRTPLAGRQSAPAGAVRHPFRALPELPGLYPRECRDPAGWRLRYSLCRSGPDAVKLVAHARRMSVNIVTEAWRVSLVIPAYNEEASILQALSEAEDALPQIADRFEILVVDDGSRDRTCQEIGRAS